MNERDSEAVAAMLRGKGYALVDNELEADVVLLNTCSVRDQAEQKAIGKAGHLAKRSEKTRTSLLGSWAAWRKTVAMSYWSACLIWI